MPPLGTPSLGSSPNRPVIADDLPPSLPTIKSENILKRVFTHSSLAGGNRDKFQMPEDDPDADNEPLGHIGDQVFGLVVTDLIQGLYPLLHVGPASKLRDRVKGKVLLAEVCMSYGLHERLDLLERKAGSLRASQKVQADVFKAYVGGLYRDQGIEVVTKWLTSLFDSHVRAAYRTVRTDHLLPPETADVPQPGVPSARYPSPSSSEGGGSILPSQPAGLVSRPHQHVPSAGGGALDAPPEVDGRPSRRRRRQRSNPKEGGSEDAGPSAAESARKRARSRGWDNI